VSETVTLYVPLLNGADNVHGVLQGAVPPLMLASAPAGVDSTRTGVPDDVNPGRLGALMLGRLNVGMLGIPVHADSAAPHAARAIARLVIQDIPGPRGRFTQLVYDLGHNTNRRAAAQPRPEGIKPPAPIWLTAGT
jgi:hypothetical protein